MAGKQLEFDFQRRNKLWMLEKLQVRCDCAAEGKRRCECGKTVKSLLKALDGFARNDPQCRVTVKNIGLSMGTQSTATKRAIRVTARLGYISVLSADEADGLDTDRKRSGSMSTYKIEWLKIWNETEEKAPQRVREDVGVEPATRTQSSRLSTQDGVRVARNLAAEPAVGDHVPPPKATTPLSPGDHVPPLKRPPAPPPSSSSSSLSTNSVIIVSDPPGDTPDDGDDGGEDFWKPEDPEPEVTLEDAVDMLRAAGVERARAAVNVAEAHGMTPAGIVAVARHALAHPGRWNPQVIYTRVTSLDAIDQPPDEGWFGENPNWRPATPPQTATAAESGPSLSELEREHLATLQAMNLEELQTLLPFLERRMQGRVTAAIARKEDPRTTTLKGLLLEALHRRRQRDGPSATSTA